VANQDPVDGRYGRGVAKLIGEEALKLGSPPTPTPAELEEAFLHPGGQGVGAGMGPVGSVDQAREALLLVPAHPLVARGSADAVPAAEFGEGEVAVGGFEDELGSLIHDGLGSPGHRLLLSEDLGYTRDL